MTNRADVTGPSDHLLARSLLESMPFGVLLVRSDLSITDLNGRAAVLFGGRTVEVVGQQPGDALHCVTALAAEKGCGSGEPCPHCLLRRTGMEALAGHRVEQREVHLRLREGEAEQDVFLLVSAAPLAVEEERFAVLTVQDVTALHRLRGLIPICASCKKIRRDDQAWEALEAFITERSHAEFSHALCPDCLQQLYPEYYPAR